MEVLTSGLVLYLGGALAEKNKMYLRVQIFVSYKNEDALISFPSYLLVLNLFLVGTLSIHGCSV